VVFGEEVKVWWRVSGTRWFSVRSSQWTQWGLGFVRSLVPNNFCACGEVV
jgi:hypothetical protein